MIKKTKPAIKNSILALIILFFIPLLVNVVLNLVDSNTNLGKCIEQANHSTIQTGSSFIKITEDQRKNPLSQENYENGTVKLSSETTSVDSNNNNTNNTNNSSNPVSDSGITTNSTHKNNKNNLTFNLYNQADSRWGSTTYSSGSTIKDIGCMITSVAVVSSAYEKSVTPYTVFKSAPHSHPRNSIPSLSKKFSCTAGSTNSQNIKDSLNKGQVVVIKVYGKKKGGSSKFTTSQHYMALIDINGEQIFVGNAYGNYTHGKWGWFPSNDVLTSTQAADYCTPN